MNTETATSVSATHPADIEMQANSTVFHQSTANSTIISSVHSVGDISVLEMNCTNIIHKDKDLQIVFKESLSTRINITDVAVSVFIIFQRLLCKSLQVVSKVLVLAAPVLVNITAYYWTTSLLLQTL